MCTQYESAFQSQCSDGVGTYLKGDFQARLQQYGREVGVQLSRQPQSEVLMRSEGVDFLVGMEGKGYTYISCGCTYVSATYVYVFIYMYMHMCMTVEHVCVLVW